MNSLRVPGTTIAITLLPGFVEVRDKGLVKKKISVRNRAFEEVLEDLEIFFQAHGKRLPPGVLTDTLIRIGVPRAKRIITQETFETEKKEEPVEVVAPPLDIRPDEPEEPEEIMPQPLDVHLEEPQIEIKEYDSSSRIETSQHIDIKPGETLKLSEQDLPDIEEALMTVEALSDSFMAPKENSARINTKPQIRISISGTEEIQASDTSTASVPSQYAEEEQEIEAPPDVDDIDVTGIGDSSEIELHEEMGITYEIPDEEIEAHEELVVESKIEEEATEYSPASFTLEEATHTARKTPVHAVKPLVSAKAVILGEDGVGKHSLLEKAELRLGDADEGEVPTYIRSGIIQLADHRVNLSVWSFDDAANERIPRKEFYSDVDVVIIVYAVSDRWSFESIDFWLREAMVKNQDMAPIVIVGNKKDIREAGEPDPLEPAVTSDEGFRMAETLAKRFGTKEKLHPVAFIETSCLTGEGTKDVFKTASEFYTTML